MLPSTQMKPLRSTVLAVLATALLSAGFDRAVDALQSAFGFAPRNAEGPMLAQPNKGKNTKRDRPDSSLHRSSPTSAIETV